MPASAGSHKEKQLNIRDNLGNKRSCRQVNFVNNIFWIESRSQTVYSRARLRLICHSKLLKLALGYPISISFVLVMTRLP